MSYNVHIVFNVYNVCNTGGELETVFPLNLVTLLPSSIVT